MYSDPSAGVTSLVLSLVVVAIVLLVLYFIIRNAVTDGMKNYQQWRETTGRDVPPADPTTPTAGR